MLNKYMLVRDLRTRFQLLVGLSKLKQTDDFRLFVELLDELQSAIDKQNRTAKSPRLEQGQGAAQLLEDILELIGEAEYLREQTRQQTENAGIPDKASAF